MHRWHHRADYKDAQVNFGAWLTIWDYIFKTAYDNPRMQSELGEIGIAEERNFPKKYGQQFLYPFNKKIQEKSKTTLLTTAILFTSTIAFAQNKSDEVLGQWLTSDNNAKIEIYKTADKYFGKIIWIEPSPKALAGGHGHKNAKPVKVGQIILNDFVFNGSDTWKDGTIYDPNNDETYSCYLILERKNKLKIRGYIGFSIFGRTEY